MSPTVLRAWCILTFFIYLFFFWKRSFVKALREITASEWSGRMRMGRDWPHQETTAGWAVEGPTQAKKTHTQKKSPHLGQKFSLFPSMHLVFANVTPKCVAAIHQHMMNSYICCWFCRHHPLTSRWSVVSGGDGTAASRHAAWLKRALAEWPTSGKRPHAALVRLHWCRRRWCRRVRCDFLCWWRRHEEVKAFCLLERGKTQNGSEKTAPTKGGRKKQLVKIWRSLISMRDGKKCIKNEWHPLATLLFL